MIRAAIYARVSSLAQRESQTIESQLRVLPAFVASQGWQLIGTYIDDGKSAKTGKLDRRDGFARLAKDATAKKFDVLVVIDIDRLTRTDDMQERAAILGPFQAAGIRIVTPSGGELDLRTMLGELYVTLQAMFAAEENRKRSERTKRGLLRTAEDGGKPNGWTPYGLVYDREAKSWSHHSERAEVVREIYRRVIAGESCQRIADDLYARRVPSQKDVWKDHTVWRIVTARYPAGEWLANSAHRVVVKVPPIVDEATWQRAQDAVGRNKTRGLRRTRHVYLLEKLGACGACGGVLWMQTSDGGRHPARYICKNRRNVRPGQPKCMAPSALVSVVDSMVWDAVCAELNDPRLPSRLARMKEQRSQNHKEWERDVAKYKANTARLNKAEQGMLARYRKGLISDDALDAELAALRKERAFIAEQMQTAERASAGEQADSTDPAAWVAALRLLASSGSDTDRRRVTLAVVHAAKLKQGSVWLTMKFRAVQQTSAASIVVESASRTEDHYTLRKRVVLKAVS